MAKQQRILIHPMVARPGARYRCFGDGLCCTDIHGLGPLTRSELIQIRRIDREGAHYSDDFEDNMLEIEADGGCHFLMSDQRCAIHAQRGPEHKPDGCRQFPYRLAATPLGGRVSTKHRCPCRTMGERPLLDINDAVSSLQDSRGKLESTHDVIRIRYAKRKFVHWEQWQIDESNLLNRLTKKENPLDVLEAKPFCKLKDRKWKDVGREFIREKDGSRFGSALGWFGDTILHLLDGRMPRPPERPWKEAFDRAEERSVQVGEPIEILNDWVADELWSLEWAANQTLFQFRAEMGTRIAIAQSISTRLSTQGIRQDRAMAEAVTIVDLIGSSEYWEDVVKRIVHD